VASRVPPGFVENCTEAGKYEIFSLVANHNAGKRVYKSEIPIVLVHGAIVSHRYLMPVAQLLADNFPIYVPDLVGHGRSSKTINALGVIEQAKTLIAWIEALNHSKVRLLANSYGCEIITEMAIMRPDLVDRLILTAPTADPAHPTVREQAFLLFCDALRENPLMGFVLLRDMSELGWKRGMQTTQIMVDYDYLPRLPLVTTKTLVVGGEKDPLAPKNWIDRVVSLLPDGRSHIISGAPHNVNFTTPSHLNEAVLKFLLES
jgi:pimeloyl-ACP methyl ester carboxylesterase